MADPVADFVKDVMSKLEAPKIDYGSVVIGVGLVFLAIVLHRLATRQPPGAVARVGSTPPATLPVRVVPSPAARAGESPPTH